MAEARLHHLALGARDPDTVATFYRDVLELPEVARHHLDSGELRSVWLSLAGGAVLMIERVAAEEPRDERLMRPGLFLVAFDVPASERAAMEERLAAAGHAIEARTEYTSYLRDPEDNRVAISSFPLPVPSEMATSQ